jgi:hypothetical protein
MDGLRLQLHKKYCQNCLVEMRFYQGCGGNLPSWQCPTCGRADKWEKKEGKAEKYLKLK